MSPDKERYVLAWIAALLCWGMLTGVVGWIGHSLWMR